MWVAPRRPGALETARRTRGTGAQLEAEPALEGIFAAIRYHFRK